MGYFKEMDIEMQERGVFADMKIEERASDRQIGGEHYKNTVQPWDVVDTWPIEQRIGYYRGSALKYVMRMGSKDATLQEIRKCAHYIQKLDEVVAEYDGSQQW